MPRLTIIGLGYIGSSLGLALKARQPSLEIVGHDLDHERMHAAKKLGAIDRTDWNLPSALDGANLVIVAVPLRAIDQLFGDMAPHLAPGCVVTDTVPLKRPVLSAARSLGPEVSFVGGHPISARQGDDRPSADAFQGRAYGIVAAPDAADEAIRLVLRMVESIGAKPLILDEAEHDAHSAALDQLPSLLAVAFWHTVVKGGAWRDGQQLGGERFQALAESSLADSAELRARFLTNRATLLERLEAFQDELAALADLVRTADAEALLSQLAAAEKARAAWRNEGPAEPPGPAIDPPRARDTFRSLFWGGRRLRP